MRSAVRGTGGRRDSAPQSAAHDFARRRCGRRTGKQTHGGTTGRWHWIYIERSMSEEAFCTFFKSITADNLASSSRPRRWRPPTRRSSRTRLYYAHPCASWERGSNENANRIVRWFIPKGSALSRVTHSALTQIEEWINTCPRRILGFKTAEELFIQEMAA